ncbi:hypothetical protein NGK36_15535 [Hafnia alvei]|uniref:hypothetical protein n=1 Tax=Hafniaceae TaxID=1903412 RepID=UPI00155E3599|nr:MULTISPECIES: hypothetical protein [Hafniaceae]MEB7890688.1 hypothetical protein [Hafnia alvei]
MCDATELDALNAIQKIQALATAASYLTATEAERQLGLDIVDLITEIATKALEANHG